MTKTKIDARFWAKVRRTTGCWEWLGSRSQYGYGIIQQRRLRFHAHRVSWAMHFGDIPNGMYVCHHCDNPACVRPDHLFLGTHQDNMADKISKGRATGGSRPGEMHPLSKLTDEAVRVIRAEYTPGKRGHGAAAAKRFGVSISAIYLVLRNKSWRHI